MSKKNNKATRKRLLDFDKKREQEAEANKQRKASRAPVVFRIRSADDSRRACGWLCCLRWAY
jgi:hypothetical protein